MLRFNSLVIMIFFSIYLIIFTFLVKKRTSVPKHIFSFGAYLYMMILISKLFFPIPVLIEQIEYYRIMSPGVDYNMIPFNFISILGEDIWNVQVWGNIVMTVPLGIFISMWMYKKSVLRLSAMGLLICILFEVSQLTMSYLYKFGYRMVDVDDLILNFAGCMTGILLFELFAPLYLKKYRI